MRKGSAPDWVEAGTSHVTRSVAPPPLPEPLHCVTVALVVLPTGLHETDGSPPPVPEPLHWLTVAAVVVAAPVMLLVTRTMQTTEPPPPLPELLQISTAVTRSPVGCPPVVV